MTAASLPAKRAFSLIGTLRFLVGVSLAILVIPWQVAPTAAAEAIAADLAFAVPVNVSIPEWDIPASDVGIPSISAGSDSVAIAWRGLSTAGFTAKYADVRSLEKRWEVVVLRGEYPQEAGLVQIASAGVRSVIAEGTPGGSVQIWISTAVGGSYEPGAILPKPDGAYSISMVDSDHVYAAGGDPEGGGFVRLFSSNDGGKTFDSGVDISLARKGVRDVSLIHGDGGLLGACWVDYRNSDSSSSEWNPDIYATRIDVDLPTMHRPIRVDDSGLSISFQGEPACGFLPDGRMLVVWKDGRAAGAGDFDLYAALSSPDMTSFGPSVRIDDAPGSEVSHQARPTVAVDGNNSSFVAWEDDRELRDTIYYTQLLTSNGTIVAGRNVAVPDVQSPALFPRIARSQAGAIYLSWQGPRATVMLTVARSPAAGGDGAPGCSWTGSSAVNTSVSGSYFLVTVSDPEGWQTVKTVSIELDGTLIVGTTNLPFVQVVLRPDTLALGNHSLNATVVDRENREGYCAWSFENKNAVSNNRAPTVSIANPPGFSVNTTSDVLFNGTVGDEDGDSVSLYLSIDGGALQAIGSSTTWSYLLAVASLAPTSHIIAFIAADEYGIGPAAVRRVNVLMMAATNPPTCGFTFPALGTPISRNATVVGYVSDPDGIDDIAGASFLIFPVVGSGTILHFDPMVLEFTVPDSLDGIQIRVNVTDREGRVAECRTSYAVSKTPITSPEVIIERPTGDEIFADPSGVLFQGTALGRGNILEKVLLWMPDKGYVPANGTQTWDLSWNVEPWESGTYTVFAFALDTSGRISSPDQVAFTIIRNKDEVGRALVSIDKITINPATPSTASIVTIKGILKNYGSEELLGLSYRVSVKLLGDPSSEKQVLQSGTMDVPGKNVSTLPGVSWIPSRPGEYEILVELNYDETHPASSIIKDKGLTRIQVAGADTVLGTPIDVSLIVVVAAIGLVVAALTIMIRRARDKEDKPERRRRIQ